MKILGKVAIAMIIAATALGASAAELAILQNGFEIRHEQREAIGQTTRLYLKADRTGGYVDVPTDQIVAYERDDSIRVLTAAAGAAPARVQPPATHVQSVAAIDFNAAVNIAGKTHSIDPDLISSVIHAESSFNPRAVSPKGAQGLMQLMPDTASKLGVKDSFDPEANLDGGTRYLRELLLRYNDDMAKALAAYNAGPQRVDQYKGVPPYHETREYVARIIRDFNRKKLAARKPRIASTQKPGTHKAASARAPDVHAVARTAGGN